MEKVLVVDDSASVRQIKLALDQASVPLVEACDGVQPLRVLETDASIGQVLCDVSMPNMTGSSCSNA